MKKIELIGVMNLSSNLITWLRGDRRDNPSETIVSALTGVMIVQKGTHPTTYQNFECIFDLMEKEPLVRDYFHLLKFLDRNWKIISENINKIEEFYEGCKSLKSINPNSYLLEIIEFNIMIENILK